MTAIKSAIPAANMIAEATMMTWIVILLGIAIEETEIAIMVGTIAAETVVAGSITAGMNAVEMSITRKVAAETIVAELIVIVEKGMDARRTIDADRRRGHLRVIRLSGNGRRR